MYRIVFLDIDGTILNSQGQLDSELIKTVRKLQKNGVLVALATGRSLDGAKIYGQKLGTSLYVAYNGGYVILEENVIHDVRLSSSLSYYLCKKTMEANGVFIHFSYGSSLSNQPQHGIEYLLPEAELAITTDTNRDAHRLALYLNSNDRSLIQKEITEAACFDEGDRLEVFPKGSKWTGILPLINKLGISPNEVVSIGNGTNDIEMLKSSGLGIAMKNSPNSVKDSADLITESNDNHGVVFALSKVFNLKSSLLSL